MSCFDMIPPNFACKCSILHCRRFAPTLFPHGGNNRAASIRPYERLEISAQLIQWHRLRRGGAPRSESKFNDRRGQSHHNITAISRPPTWQIFEQKRIGPVMFRCCQYAMFRHDTAEFHLQIFNIALSALCADVISLWGK